jgi:hypothetical protein
MSESQSTPAPQRKKGCLNSIGAFITPEMVAAAMEKHKGDRNAARNELGISIGQLTGMIGGNPALLGRWRRRKLTTSEAIAIGAEILSRDPIGRAINGDTPDKLLPPPDELQLAQMIEIEDKKLKAHMKELGANEKEANLALSFTAFRDRHVQSTLALTMSGVAMNFQRMLETLRLLEERMKQAKDGSRPFSVNDKGDLVEEAIVMESYVAISEECRRTAELVWKGNIAKAKVEALIRLGANARRKSMGPGSNGNTPGFTPKRVNVSK